MGAKNAGAEPINRVSDVNVGLTYLDQTNLATAPFKGDSLEVWTNTDMANLKIGAFYLVAGLEWKCRDIRSIGSVTSGSKQTKEVSPPLQFQSGDALGWYNTDGRLEKTNAGTSLYKSGDYCTAGTAATYTSTANTLSMKISQTKSYGGGSSAGALLSAGFL